MCKNSLLGNREVLFLLWWNHDFLNRIDASYAGSKSAFQTLESVRNLSHGSKRLVYHWPVSFCIHARTLKIQNLQNIPVVISSLNPADHKAANNVRLRC